MASGWWKLEATANYGFRSPTPNRKPQQTEMKHQTKVKDIAATVAVKQSKAHAEAVASRALDNLRRHIETGHPLDDTTAKARAAQLDACRAADTLARVPRQRRDIAAATVTMAEDLARKAAHQGAYYSGDTTYRVGWGDKATAHTETGYGDQYSRSCKYHRTDATHVVTLCPEGVPELVEREALRRVSAADGLHLIDLRPDGSAVWVRAKGKAIVAESGWVAGNARCCYHSTESAKHAREGFARKLARLEKEDRERRQRTKGERRARLVSRLCNVTATIEDAKALGFCQPGIEAFQQRHGIGDKATLPELVRTGDPSAVRLALSIARKV